MLLASHGHDFDQPSGATSNAVYVWRAARECIRIGMAMTLFHGLAGRESLPQRPKTLKSPQFLYEKKKDWPIIKQIGS